MTLMLASVRDADEIAIALDSGVDIIDLKDPTNGSLGAVEIETVRRAVEIVAKRRPVSAVTGDLPMEPELFIKATAAFAKTGVDYVKVGLYAGPGRKDCIRALSGLGRSVKIIGVMFADEGADIALLEPMAESGFAGAMLDTAHKRRGNLLDHASVPALADFVAACRTHGLMSGLAGSLEPPDVPRLLLTGVDVLGFRGALCPAKDRTASLDRECVALIRDLIPFDQRSGALKDVTQAVLDQRILAARGYSFDPARPDAADRVFVRDMVLPVRIGVYAREEGAPQNVRFNIDVRVRRLDHQAADMRDVFSYDIIVDGIRMITAHEHFPFVETLAERIAMLLLGDPRVLDVTIRVEKLDVGPGALGVEIKRERARDVADISKLYPIAKAAE